MRWLWAMIAVMMTMNVFAAVDYKVVTQQNVTDSREIEILREELFLGSETIERILITDILNDGFDQNDAAVLYPTGRVLRLEPISERLDSLLRSFKLPPNTEIYEGLRYHSAYDSVSVQSRGGRALGYGLMGGLQQRLELGYRGKTVEGYFKFSESGAQVRLWNFDSTRVSFPLPESPRSDTVIVFQHDTIYVPEIVTVEKDPIVIRDTVYLPSELLKKPRGLFYREALGMMGGGYSMANREASRGRLTIAAGNEWDFGVWDQWVSGRQEIDSRVGLRFTAEMAPWKSDTLSPRFLSTQAELMYIPAWDRGLFAFAGIRAFFGDDLFWDRVRAGWDEDLYSEPSGQDLAHYEFAVKSGLDKLAPYGTGKNIGFWLKGAVWLADKSGYTLELDRSLATEWIPALDDTLPWRWEHTGGSDIAGNVSVRVMQQLNVSAGAGLMTLPNLDYKYPVNDAGASRAGLFALRQFYQTISLRVTPLSAEDYQLRVEGSYRNNGVSVKWKDGEDKDFIEEIFYPYFEAPQIDGSVQLDYNIVQVRAGVSAFMPKDLDAQIRPWGGLYFMFK